MSAIQLVVIVFGVAMAFGTYRGFRRRDLLAPEAALWFVVWLALIAVTAFPDALRTVIGPLKVARLLDLVMIAAILLLTAIVFVLHSRVGRLERRLVELVQRLALSAEHPGGNGKQPIGKIHGKPEESRA